MKIISTKDFSKEVLEHEGVTLVDFYADWCGPCRMLGPILEELDKDNKDKGVKFVKINVDDNQETAALYGVMSIPTVIIFKNGRMVEQKVGVESKNAYKDSIEKAKSFKPAKNKQEVTVFTTPSCPYCHMAKDFLKDKKVAYKEIDVSKDQEMAMQMTVRSGQMGVPQLWIGEQVVVGFNKPQIETLLGL